MGLLISMDICPDTSILPTAVGRRRRPGDLSYSSSPFDALDGASPQRLNGRSWYGNQDFARRSAQTYPEERSTSSHNIGTRRSKIEPQPRMLCPLPSFAQQVNAFRDSARQSLRKWKAELEKQPANAVQDTDLCHDAIAAACFLCGMQITSLAGKAHLNEDRSLMQAVYDTLRPSAFHSSLVTAADLGCLQVFLSRPAEVVPTSQEWVKQEAAADYETSPSTPTGHGANSVKGVFPVLAPTSAHTSFSDSYNFEPGTYYNCHPSIVPVRPYSVYDTLQSTRMADDRGYMPDLQGNWSRTPLGTQNMGFEHTSNESIPQTANFTTPPMQPDEAIWTYGMMFPNSQSFRWTLDPQVQPKDALHPTVPKLRSDHQASGSSGTAAMPPPVTRMNNPLEQNVESRGKARAPRRQQLRRVNNSLQAIASRQDGLPRKGSILVAHPFVDLTFVDATSTVPQHEQEPPEKTQATAVQQESSELVEDPSINRKRSAVQHEQELQHTTREVAHQHEDSEPTPGATKNRKRRKLTVGQHTGTEVQQVSYQCLSPADVEGRTRNNLIQLPKAMQVIR